MTTQSKQPMWTFVRAGAAFSVMFGGWGVMAGEPAQPLPPGAVGEVTPKTDSALLDMRVTRLGDESLNVREAATLELANDPRLTTRMVEQYLRRSDITEEQRMRLGSVGLARFRAEPRAAMGVAFDRGFSISEGVTIRSAIEGFDSARVLQPGDVIVTLDGQHVRNDSQARIVILSREPGEEIELKILRRGEPLMVRVTLGNLHDLKDGPTLDPVLIRRLWEYRMERAAGDHVGFADKNGGAIVSGISEARWEAIAKAVKSAEESAGPGANNEDYESDSAPGLSGGGSLREPKPEAMVRFSARAATKNPAMASLEVRRDEILQRMRDLQMKLVDQKLRVEDRNTIRVMYMNLQRQLDDVREKIRRQAAVDEH